MCDHCGGSFLHIKQHKVNCLQLEKHLCNICGDVFPLRSTLVNHIRTIHSGEKPYPCNLCDRRFSCHANRNRHMRIHNNHFPYMCDTCGQKFRHSNSLKDHMTRIHHINVDKSPDKVKAPRKPRPRYKPEKEVSDVDSFLDTSSDLESPTRPAPSHRSHHPRHASSGSNQRSGISPHMSWLMEQGWMPRIAAPWEQSPFL